MSLFSTVRAGTVVMMAASFAACSGPAADAQHAADAASATDETPTRGEPILLHARVDYGSDSVTSGVSERHFVLAMDVEQPAFREGSGARATYSGDSARERVRGFMKASGSARVVSADTTLTENYAKSATWPQLQAVDGAYFSLLAPEASLIGEGLHVRLELRAPVKGQGSAHVQGEGGSADTDPLLSVPSECSSRDQKLDGNVEGCGVVVDLEPAPTHARDAAGEVMLPKVTEALAQPDGPWAMAMLGDHFGATTEYRPGGHFVQRFSKSYEADKDGAHSRITVNVTVWSTARGENWVPKDLPPLPAK